MRTRTIASQSATDFLQGFNAVKEVDNGAITWRPAMSASLSSLELEGYNAISRVPRLGISSQTGLKLVGYIFQLHVCQKKKKKKDRNVPAR